MNETLPVPAAAPATNLAASVLGFPALASPRASGAGRSFRNPILPAPSADPWMIFHEGAYYYCESHHNLSIHVRQGAYWLDIPKDPGAMVWSPPRSGPYCHEVWAPELHWIEGRCYIYFAADDGKNENHRMWVLAASGSDPLGPYTLHGPLETEGWAIDGTVLRLPQGLFFIWSGWPGAVNGQQNLYIAPMKDPVTLAGPRVCLAVPSQPWERIGMPICEGPQILQREGRTFLVFSASGSWTVDYCLGMLVLEGENPMEASAWRKTGPVMQKTSQVWGLGHCSFTTEAEGAEDWIFYHVKSKRKEGWKDRNVHAQRFHWDARGWPVFGKPTPRGMLCL